MKFNIPQALRFAALAYKRPDDGEDEYRTYVRPQLRNLGCGHVEFFDHAGTQGFIGINESGAVLAFRGTELTCMKDIKADIRGRLKTLSHGIKVHSGFYHATDAIMAAVQNSIPKRDTPIYLTGHSLGAAIALIAAYVLSMHKFNLQKVVTFGSPRVGNRNFRKHLERTCIVKRVVNRTDIVPYFGSGGHVGSLVFVNEYGVERDHVIWHTALSVVVMSVYYALRWRLIRQALRDHAITEYMKVFR